MTVGADAVATLFEIPVEVGPHFLKLELKDKAGKTAARQLLDSEPTN